MSQWAEVGDGVFQRRYDPLDISVCVVRGADGLLVVDTRSNHHEGAEIRRDLRALSPQPVRWVVNTHAHFDHTFGNHCFGPAAQQPATIYGHRLLPAHHETYERPMLERPEFADVVLTSPSELVDRHHVLDLGNRAVELVHLGRGHTDNDLLLHAADVDVWLVGDVVEESGPPMYGSGSFPLDWPETVARLVERLGPSTTIVPGHGAPVGREFVVAQHRDLLTVADLIRELYAAGVPAGDAVAVAGTRWPFPADGLQRAVDDAYGMMGP
jgi:glyoxylase-like metal-dependent hydrolase (beta-lactamase superfamily II)